MIYDSWIKYGLINIQDFCTGNSRASFITLLHKSSIQTISLPQKKKVNLTGEKKETYHKLKNQDCMDYVKNSNQNEICVNKNTRAAKEFSLERIPLCLVKHVRRTSPSYLRSLPPVLHLCESFSDLFFWSWLKGYL